MSKIRDPIKPDELPAAVRRFIERRIEGIEQLEILLLLHREAARYWDAASVAQSLQLTERNVADHLEALGRQALLDVRIAAAVVYRFNPATPTLALEVKKVADAYRERRGELLALLTPYRHRSLKDFSDAFRFTKDPEDG